MGFMQGLIDAFSQGGIRGQQHQRTEEDIQKQEQQRAAENHDKAMADYMDAIGAQPVQSGMVHRQMFTPPVNMGDYSDIPGVNLPKQVPETSGWVLDKADPARVVTHKAADGQTVQWERPSVEQQQLRAAHLRLANLQNPSNREAVNIEEGQTEAGARAKAQGTAQGTASGKMLGEEENRNTLGSPATQEEQDRYGLPGDTRLLPSERVGLAGKVVPVVTRVEGQKEVAKTNVAGRENVAEITGNVRRDVADTTANSRENVADINAGSRKDVANINASKPGARGGLTPGQNGVQNRFNQRLQANDSKTHEQLQTKEQDLWAQHGALGDVLNTPDGQPFVDPTSKTSKEVTMNAAQRKVMQARYNTIEAAAKQAQAGAVKIRQKYGWGEFAPGAGNPSPAAHTVTPAATDKVKIKTSDGKVGFIPKANLAKLKSVDPGAQVVP